ncbi:MAG: hypothetical protein WC641_06615 [Patescibacteria group bacterium]
MKKFICTVLVVAIGCGMVLLLGECGHLAGCQDSIDRAPYYQRGDMNTLRIIFGVALWIGIMTLIKSKLEDWLE